MQRLHDDEIAATRRTALSFWVISYDVQYLFEALTGRPRALGPLRPREVDKVKLRPPYFYVVRVHLVNQNFQSSPAQRKPTHCSPRSVCTKEAAERGKEGEREVRNRGRAVTMNGMAIDLRYTVRHPHRPLLKK